MPRLNEITSTEKLLNLIRGKDNKVSEKPQTIHSSSKYKKILSNPFNKIIPRQKAVTLGIDIGFSHIRLVKVMRTSDNRWKLIDWKQIPIPPALAKGSDEFARFLKSETSSFCGTWKMVNIWVLMSAANVEVRHIRIPKVSGKEIANAVYWTIKKEVPFDEKENFIDFEVQGEVIEQGINKIAVMAYIAPVREVEDMKRLFSKVDMPLTGITIVPFAIQNIFRNGWCNDFEERFAILFIGNDFSRIDIYNRGSLVMTRDIKAGTNSMIDSLMEEYNLRQKSSGSSGELPEGTSLAGIQPGIQIDRADAREMLFSLDPEFKGESGKDFSVMISKEDIFSMIAPAIERAVRQVERTFGYYATLPGGEKIEKVYVSGVLSVYAPLVEYTGDQLGIKSAMLDIFKRYTDGFREDKMIDLISDRIAVVPALGAALSENKSALNLIFTYKDKEKEASEKRVNRNIFITFAAAVVICSIIFAYQTYSIRQKGIHLTSIQRRFSRTMYLNRDMVRQVASSVKEQQGALKIYSKRYRGMAVFSELSNITPPEIGLQRLKVSLGGFSTEGQTSESDGASGESVVIEGVINGDRSYAEAALSRYVMKLDSSPMFSQINVKDSNYGAALYFTINVKIG